MVWAAVACHGGFVLSIQIGTGMKKYIAFLIFISLLIAGCNEGQRLNEVQRFGSITGLKPEKLDYYKELHADVWPAVLDKIAECNIRNYSIYLQQIGDAYYLFSYFEYTGSDFEADMQRMADDPDTQRWWKETDPCQLPLGDEGIWTTMEEVFHTD